MRLPAVVSILHKAVNRNGGITYIHCTAGLGRAPAAAVCLTNSCHIYIIFGLNVILFCAYFWISRLGNIMAPFKLSVYNDNSCRIDHMSRDRKWWFFGSNLFLDPELQFSESSFFFSFKVFIKCWDNLYLHVQMSSFIGNSCM